MSNWDELTSALTINGLLSDRLVKTDAPSRLFGREDIATYVNTCEAVRVFLDEIPDYYFASFCTKKLAKYLTEEQIEEYGWKNMVDFYYEDYKRGKRQWKMNWEDVNSIRRNYIPLVVEYLIDIDFEDKTGTLDAIKAGIPMEEVLA